MEEFNPMRIRFRVSTHTEDRSDMKQITVEFRLVTKRSSIDNDQYISVSVPREEALRDYAIGSCVEFAQIKDGKS